MWNYINYAWAALKNDKDTQQIMHMKYVRNVWTKERGSCEESGLKRTTRQRQERQAKNGRNMRTCGQNVCMFWPNKLNEFKQRSSHDSPPFPSTSNKPERNAQEKKNPKKIQAKSRHKTAKCLKSSNKKREQIVFAFGIGMPKATTTTTTGNNNGNGRAKIEREREGGATVAVAGIIIKSTNRF